MTRPARTGTTALALQSAAESLTQIETELGGRSSILQALITAPQTKDVKYVIGLLADPDRKAATLAELCMEAKITPGVLLDMLERGTKLRTRIIAGHIIAQGTPAMVRDVMEKAAPFHDDCTDCQGTGTHVPEPSAENLNPNPEKCKICAGTGKLRYEADPECRKLGLEIAGLTSRGGGISIVQQNQTIVPQMGAGLAFEALQELQDRLMYGRPAALPAAVIEVIDPAEPA